MNILLTGANGYIGMRLLPVLVESGHEVTCVVRDKNRFKPAKDLLDKINIIEFDFLHPENAVPCFKNKQFDAAYYLIHSLSDTSNTLKEYELRAAGCFVLVALLTNVKQIIYLSGISNDDKLSNHLTARKVVKDVFIKSGIPYTIFEAGIIVGSGSISFEIIRDLTEKLPVMIVPRWLNSKCQPIAIRNVIYYLQHCVHNEKTYFKTFEIGGPDIFSYKQMLLGLAKVRGYKRYIITFPVLFPGFSVYWLNLTTSANFTIAKQLVHSMKNDVVCKEYAIREIIPQYLFTYEEAIKLAFARIEQNMVVSSWTDSASSSLHRLDVSQYIEVPVNGCFKDKKWIEISTDEIEEVANRFFSIGGEQGWYYADSLWRIRGVFDKLIGGVGLSRGRRSKVDIEAGDTIDFWRVILADKKNHRLLLFAEMKLPGEAWLEFSIINNNNRSILKQTATFRPKGIMGRNYWYSMLPFHYFIFRNMIKRIAGKK
ncbi:MAG TPA: SDR family oxidoreductase [Chitinophagaceae bacterium]|nr:SDR family oxidoreductase [Chitinophagaceae bacterium]HNE92740.1 SDR family oxidoreductase [Chitinophagaceae bacterium]HNF29293.1 SDR family oxidoreductase [Chitinophagaceae bacterium]HNJ57827.1 SDR family oxidoreductase [Chitinophagaceae bacterium]HNN30296.1 SDR family oxidoreductase [Chitinophagaceae bacterium]